VRLTDLELRDLYRDDYVSNYPKEDNGRLARLLPYFDLDPDDNVLDVACGNGLLVDFIHDHIRGYTGIDFSAEFIREAENRCSDKGIQNAQFVCEDAIIYCEQHPSAFGKVFLNDFSEHVYDDDFVKILMAARETLVRGGTLYLHTPNREYLLEVAKHRGLLKNHPGHVAVRTAKQLCLLLDDAGFPKHEIHYPAHYVPLLARFHFLSNLPFVGRFFRARLLIAAQSA
jgi:2-polyprenyl-3-methyl-5-hydroxy-6-metoxy-1,4-benzoquinol methylase